MKEKWNSGPNLVIAKLKGLKMIFLTKPKGKKYGKEIVTFFV
jgi:hypothetical protein